MTAAPGRPRIFPAALATLIALGILVALGVWQLQRREWKLRILAAIDRAESGPSVPLHADPAPFSKVSVTGTLLPRKVLYGVEVREQLSGQPREGAQLVGVLERQNGPAVVVDLGWVPIGDGAPDPLAQTKDAAKPMIVSGYVRAPDHSNFLSAPDDPVGRHFYALDPVRIAAALGVKHVAPFTLIAMGTPASPEAPVPADALPRPPNNHLQYAFTWFGLAGALIAVFVAWLRRRSADDTG